MKPFRLALIILVIGLGLLAGRVAWFKIEPMVFSQQFHDVPDISDDLATKTFPIKRIQVLKGDFFEITFRENDIEKRVLGELPVSATEDAKTKVLDLMNHCTEPKVYLKSKGANGRWLVEINFVYNEKGVNLSTWLTQNGLTYKNE